MFTQKENDFQPLKNLLPYEGCAEYYGKVFD